MLNSAELSWCIEAIEGPDSSALFDTLELLDRVSGVILRPLEVLRWLKSKFEWEDNFGFFSTGLIVPGHVRETDSLDVVSLSVELEKKWSQSDVGWVWDVIGPVVLEEVPPILSIDAEHRDEIGRVDSISEELESETWGNST